MNMKLLQLLLDNRRPDGKSRSRFEAAAKDGGETTVYLYDPIVGSRMLAELFGYVCAQEMVPSIDGVKGGTLVLRVNCPGGDVFAMQAIMNALRAASERGVRLVGQVDGVAASAATGILAVCDEVIMGAGTQYMIHNSQGMAMGDRNELRALADLMEKVDGGMLEAYMAKSGKPEAAIRGWMDAETWFTAEQAVDNGFADRVNASGKKAKASADWKLDAFANAPKAEADQVEAELNADEAQFLQDMIPHHEMALEMAKAVMPKASSGKVIKLAEGVIAAQAGEIELMQTWLDQSNAPAAKKKRPMKMEANYITDEHRERQQQRLRMLSLLTA